MAEASVQPVPWVLVVAAGMSKTHYAIPRHQQIHHRITRQMPSFQQNRGRPSFQQPVGRRLQCIRITKDHTA
jgi:hypothetical protein